MLIRSKGSISDRVRLGEIHLQFLCAVISTLEKLKASAVKEVVEMKKRQKKKTERDTIEAEESGLQDRRKEYYVQLAPIPIEWDGTVGGNVNQHLWRFMVRWWYSQA